MSSYSIFFAFGLPITLLYAMAILKAVESNFGRQREEESTISNYFSLKDAVIATIALDFAAIFIAMQTSGIIKNSYSEFATFSILIPVALFFLHFTGYLFFISTRRNRAHYGRLRYLISAYFSMLLLMTNAFTVTQIIRFLN